jgi:hypothetical protein
MYVSVETQNEMYMYGMENGRINADIATARGPWPSRAILERVRRPARFTSIPMVVSSTAPIAPRLTEFQSRQVFRAVKQHRGLRVDQSTGEHTDPAHQTQKIPAYLHIDPSGRCWWPSTICR